MSIPNQAEGEVVAGIGVAERLAGRDGDQQADQHQGIGWECGVHLEGEWSDRKYFKYRFLSQQKNNRKLAEIEVNCLLFQFRSLDNMDLLTYLVDSPIVIS